MLFIRFDIGVKNNLTLRFLSMDINHATYFWQIWYAGQLKPYEIVYGIEKIDGSEIFVGRAFYNGELLSASVVPSRAIAFIPWGGYEIALHECEIMVNLVQYGSYFDWVPTSSSFVPYEGVPVDYTFDKETLLAGWVDHYRAIHVEKVDRGYETCSVPYRGGEFSYYNYEVLCKYF